MKNSKQTPPTSPYVEVKGRPVNPSPTGKFSPSPKKSPLKPGGKLGGK